MQPDPSWPGISSYGRRDVGLAMNPMNATSPAPFVVPAATPYPSFQPSHVQPVASLSARAPIPYFPESYREVPVGYSYSSGQVMYPNQAFAGRRVAASTPMAEESMAASMSRSRYNGQGRPRHMNPPNVMLSGGRDG